MWKKAKDISKHDSVRMTAVRACVYLVIIIICMMPLSCAPRKAAIDRTAMNKILWPGPPEEPRISYLWSVSDLSDAHGDRFFTFLAGEETGITDPRSLGSLSRPYGLFVDNNDRLYITDSGAYRVTIIDLRSSVVKNIFRAGKTALLSPIGVVALDEKIFISDSLLKKVFIVNSDGDLIGEFAGNFERPTSMALDRERRLVYVSDTPAHTIYRYDTEGKRLGSVGVSGTKEGELNFPTHLWVDGDGRLYVTDLMNFRVQVFSRNGVFESEFGTLGDAYGDLDKPKGLATDSEGNIYVVDSIKDMVKIFNRKGQLLLFWGQKGRAYGEFWLPSGLFNGL
jgi:sugar lactone lactonase YvrE